MHGRVVHFEVPFDDRERAGRFYAEVFGWQTMHLPDMDYTLVTTGPTDQGSGPTEPGFVNGGMLQRQGSFSGPVITIEVDDIDAALTKVEQYGGTVVEGRMAVGDMGFAAYFTDPEGNLTGLWQTP